MSDLDIRQLRYFVETAQTGSMSQAAKRLYVSQQALSKGIRSLETTLGGPLFVRDKTGVRLTEFGQFFLGRARLTLSALEFAEDGYRDFSEGFRRTISLGMPANCTTDFGGSLNATNLYAFQKSYPQITFEFIETTTGTIKSRLDDGSLQFGIGATLDDESYENVLLDEFPLVVLVSRDSKLARKSCITPADLSTGRVAVPFDDESLILPIRRLGERAHVTIRTSPIMITPVDGADLVVDAGIFVVRPEQHARRTTDTSKVALIPLTDQDERPMAAALNLSWRKTRQLDEVEHALVDYIVQLYANRTRT